MARVLFSSAVVGLLVLADAGPADAQPQAPGAAPHHGLHPGHRVREPELGDPAAGRQLFQAKGCVACHAVKGQGGTVGPDLGRIDHGHNAYQMAGIMWNHSATMSAVMEAMKIPRPVFEGNEMADLLAYLEAAQGRASETPPMHRRGSPARHHHR